MKSRKTGKFYVADISSIGDDETYTTNSAVLDVSGAEAVAVQGFCTCGSACNQTTVIKIVAQVNGLWDNDDNPFVTLTIMQTASATARKSALIDVVGIDNIMITSIENTEDDNTNGDISDVNCSYSMEVENRLNYCR